MLSCRNSSTAKKSTIDEFKADREKSGHREQDLPGLHRLGLEK